MGLPQTHATKTCIRMIRSRKHILRTLTVIKSNNQTIYINNHTNVRNEIEKLYKTSLAIIDNFDQEKETKNLSFG